MASATTINGGSSKAYYHKPFSYTAPADPSVTKPTEISPPVIQKTATPAADSTGHEHTISDCLHELTHFFEKVIWEYINQGGKVAKNTLKVVAHHVPKHAGRISKAAAKVGLLSGVTFLFTVKSLPDQMKGFYKNAKIGDTEGAILSLADFAASLGSLVDDAGTVAGSLAYLGLIPAIGFFSTVGLPLAVGLLSYAALSKSYHIFRHGQFVYCLPKKIDENNLEEFKALVDKKTTAPTKKLSKRKISILSRRADPKVANIMRNLQVHLKDNPNDIETANAALKDMKKLMRRKITMGCVSVAGSTAMATSLATMAAFPAAGVAVPFVAAGKAALSIGTHTYKTFWFDSGLNLPEFAKAAPAA